MSIRVHQVKSFADGSVQLLIKGGGADDAEYVREVIENGMTTSTKMTTRQMDVLTEMRIKAEDGSRLDTKQVRHVLQADDEIEVVAGS